MSYGIIRVQKFTSGSVRGIDIHDNRKKDVSHTNPDIDFNKTNLNYQLRHQDNKSFYNAVNDRIKELSLPRAVRKDAVVMAQALVTSDKSFFDGITEEQQREFFKTSYEFIKNRYGKENIISATVHLDEKTPHMHVNFVPVTSDERLCAKDLLNKKEMQSLQNDAYESIFKPFNLERGEIKKDKQKHLTTEEFKLSKKQEIINKKEKELQTTENKLNQRESELIMKESRLKQKEEKLNRISGDINDRENILREDVKYMNLRYENFKRLNTMEPQKEILGGNYKLTGTRDELNSILNLAKRGITYDKLLDDYKKIDDKLYSAYSKIERLEKTQSKKWLDKICDEKDNLKLLNNKLTKDLKDNTKYLDIAKKVIRDNGLDDVLEKTIKIELKLAKKLLQMGMERER